MKIMTILGTRPEIIRLAEVIKMLDRHCDHVLVHTGQNYDHNLNMVFFEDLDLRHPDYLLETNQILYKVKLLQLLKKLVMQWIKRILMRL